MNFSLFLLVMYIFLAFTYLLTTFQHTTSTPFSIKLHSPSRKCFSQHFHKDAIILLNAESSDPFTFTVLHESSTQVSDGLQTGLSRKFVSRRAYPTKEEFISNIYFEDDKKTHIRALTTPISAYYHFCMASRTSQPIVINLDIKWGLDANDMAEVVRADDLSELNTQINNSLKYLQTYQKMLNYLHNGEESMKTTIKGTSNKLIGFGILNIIIISISALLQSIYFRNYFRAKKLI